MIAPNKQNLIQLGNQKKLTQNGYKLLKEKRAGLITYFLDLSATGKQIEIDLVTNHAKHIHDSKNLLSIYDIYNLNNYLFGDPSTYLHVSKKRVSGVRIDSIHVEVSAQPKEKLKKSVQIKLNDFSYSFPFIIKLAQLKLNCNNISQEILKTNRQIANLEKKIEDIDDTIKQIKAVLSDRENLEKGILIKLFV
jgi:vacuolar-type H+-ATPase subunit D/Vma8